MSHFHELIGKSILWFEEQSEYDWNNVMLIDSCGEGLGIDYEMIVKLYREHMEDISNKVSAKIELEVECVFYNDKKADSGTLLYCLEQDLQDMFPTYEIRSAKLIE